MSGCIFPVAGTVLAAHDDDTRLRLSDHFLEIRILMRFVPHLTAESGMLQRSFHIPPVNGTAASIFCNLLRILIHIHRSTAVIRQGAIDIRHTAQSAAKCPEPASIIIRISPFAGPCHPGFPCPGSLKPGGNLFGRILRFCHLTGLQFPGSAGGLSIYGSLGNDLLRRTDCHWCGRNRL